MWCDKCIITTSQIMLGLKKAISTKLSDLFINDWISTLEISRKCCCHKLFKDKLGFEDYLNITPHNLKKNCHYVYTNK